MSHGFLPMMATVVSAVAVYYYWSVILNNNDYAGIALGVVTAIIVSALFARLKRNK